MKKILSLILSLSMMTVLSACAGDKSESMSSSEETTQATAEAEQSQDAEDGAVGSAVLPEGVTFAQYLLEDFNKIASENSDFTAEQIAQKLSENKMILFSSMYMPVEEGALSGFTQEITGFKSAAMFGPAMGSIAFIGYVFELSDENTAEAFIQTLKSSADPRWQICVEAEETVCEAVGNKVFFVMAPLLNQ